MPNSSERHGITDLVPWTGDGAEVVQAPNRVLDVQPDEFGRMREYVLEPGMPRRLATPAEIDAPLAAAGLPTLYKAPTTETDDPLTDASFELTADGFKVAGKLPLSHHMGLQTLGATAAARRVMAETTPQPVYPPTTQGEGYDDGQDGDDDEEDDEPERWTKRHPVAMGLGALALSLSFGYNFLHGGYDLNPVHDVGVYAKSVPLEITSFRNEVLGFINFMQAVAHGAKEIGTVGGLVKW